MQTAADISGDDHPRSGDSTTQHTRIALECGHLQCALSRTFSVWSEEEETACFPSAVTATPETESEWLSSQRRPRLLLRSHTFSVLSLEMKPPAFRLPAPLPP